MPELETIIDLSGVPFTHTRTQEWNMLRATQRHLVTVTQDDGTVLSFSSAHTGGFACRQQKVKRRESWGRKWNENYAARCALASFHPPCIRLRKADI